MTALLGFTALALALLAWLLGEPWLRRRRRNRLGAQPLPDPWRRELARWPLYARVPAELKPRLDALVAIFVHEKEFVGCGGLEVTDAMRVGIAAQACLLVLNRDLHVFDALRSILIYPDEFVVEERFEDDGGVVVEGERVLSGQSWDTSRVILSWRDVVESGDGYNVVLHEFAHYLDEEEGEANGVPLLASHRDYERWAHVMQRAYDELAARSDAGEDTLLDPYGAEHESEFFAVATETFFELPRELADEDPALYAELVKFYGVDPARWAAAG